MKYQLFWAVVLVLALSIPVLAQHEGGAPGLLRISSGVAEGLKIHDVTPTYPIKARQKHITGNVILAVTIDTKGNVSEVRKLQGYGLLADAAIDAVKQWKYRPYLLNGQPVIVETTVKVQFHMY